MSLRIYYLIGIFQAVLNLFYCVSGVNILKSGVMGTYTEVKATNFQANLTEAMHQREVTQSQLAKMVGTRQGQISKLYNGTTTPTIEMVEKIAKALKVSPAWLGFNLGPADTTEPIDLYLSRLILYVQPNLGLLLEAFLRSNTAERNAFVHSIHNKVPDNSLTSLRDLCNALAGSSTLKGSEQIRQIAVQNLQREAQAIAGRLFTPRAGEEAPPYGSTNPVKQHEILHAEFDGQSPSVTAGASAAALLAQGDATAEKPGSKSGAGKGKAGNPARAPAPKDSARNKKGPK